MRKQTFFNLISKSTILVTLVVSFFNPISKSQKESGTSDLQVSLAELLLDQNPAPLDTHIPQIWVVRVYFESLQQVTEIATWMEPWEVVYEEGYLILGVSQADYQRLITQGFQIEIDHKYTERVNHAQEFLANQVTGIPGYPCYRTVEETYTTGQRIAANYPSLAEWIDIGDSWDMISLGGAPGYDLMLLKLTNLAITGDKPKVFIMSAVHGREFTSAELNTRFAEKLVENYDIDPDITWLLDYTEIHLLLQANPDGRKLAETGFFWRKNTSQNYCSSIPSNRGADLNRNFAFQWGCCNGSSNEECEETYHGPYAGSEPEVQAIQNYIRSIFPDQRNELLTDKAPDYAMGIFLDIHSYGELVLWPWGFTNTAAPNGAALQTLGRKFAYFNDYAPEQAINLYPTDGTSNDFVYGDLGVAAYTFELGSSFFQDCSTFEDSILPTNLLALLYAVKTSRTPYMTPSGPDTLDVNIAPNLSTKGDLLTLNATINDTRFKNNNGIEPTQNIASAEYSIDVPPWDTVSVSYQMSASDGNFDSKIEDVIAPLNTNELSTGRHILFVRGQDILGNWGAISAVFLLVDSPKVFDIEKTASSNEVFPGEVFTYSLESQLTLTGTNNFTLSLTDTLPNAVDVLTETIRVNGILTDGLYLPGEHTIRYEESGVFTETYKVELTFQVEVGNTQPFGLEIINKLNGKAILNGKPVPSPNVKKVSIRVVNPYQSDTFLPLMVNEK
ncbi:M14 family metallopeptidase [Chloroflexota bacterium]